MLSSNHRKFQRVPALLLAEGKEENHYYPNAVSIGPYHHGKPELALVEAFKTVAVELFVRFPEEKEYLYYKVLDMIGEVRKCYEGESVAKYSDADLAQMMLRDASLIIIIMECVYVQSDVVGQGDPRERLCNWEALIEHIGMFTVGLLFKDIYLVENQIPLSVIELLIKFRHGEGRDGEMIYRFVNLCSFAEDRPKVPLPQAPLHLLEFAHMVLTCGAGEVNATPRLRSGNHDRANFAKRVAHSFRSVTDLKAKGINFRPSATPLLMDVKFNPGFFCATLQLPTWIMTHNSERFFKNLVAYEWLPGSHTQPVASSYIDLMKSLIVNTEDVKELRERKVLYTLGRSDEEVLNLYKNIKLHGSTDITLFLDVRDDIQEHYNSRIKTWMADLMHTHFSSPWTFIAFVAAAAVIALTAAQLYYAVHPPK